MKKPISQIGETVFIYLMLILFLVPFYLVLNNSFRTTEQFISNPFMPASKLTFRNYIYAFEKMNFLNAMINSGIITAVSVVLVIITGAMAAYFLVRNKWKLNKIIFAVMVSAMIVPFQAMMIPLVKVYGSLNVLNNKWTLVFMYFGFGQPFAVFINQRRV